MRTYTNHYTIHCVPVDPGSMEACEVHFTITHTRLVPNIPQKALSETHHHSNPVWIIITHLAHTWPPHYSNHTISQLLLNPLNWYQMADREKKSKTPKDLSNRLEIWTIQNNHVLLNNGFKCNTDDVNS